MEDKEKTATHPAPLAPPELLAERIHSGDRSAEAELCTRYRPSVHRLLLGMCSDPVRADDLAQDVLLTVLVRLRGTGVQRPERLTNFVYQTARFMLLGALRQNRQVGYFETMDDREGSERVEHAVAREEQCDLVTRFIGSLDVHRDRELLTRSYLCGEPKAIICEELALTTTHFDRVISRARRRLRSTMESNVEDIRDAISV